MLEVYSIIGDKTVPTRVIYCCPHYEKNENRINKNPIKKKNKEKRKELFYNVSA